MKTRMMVIVAMIGVIGMAGAATAVYYYTDGNADNLDFFDPASWTPAAVPGADAEIRFGETGARPNAIGSMIYDPANQSPGDEALYTVGGGDDYVYVGRFQAGDEYTFHHESGNLVWGAFGSGNYWFWIGGGGRGRYVINAGTAAFGGLGFGDGTLEFGVGTDAIVYVEIAGTYGQSKADIEALIGSGNIVDLGSEGFVVTELVAGDYTGYTEVKLVASAPIPEPTGLGLIGLALLAVRKRRS